jgi:hypothetical protein
MREILALKRHDDGSFGIYIDGELDETYKLDDEHPEMAAGLLPIKLWRAFNKVVDKRVKSLDSSHLSISTVGTGEGRMP